VPGQKFPVHVLCEATLERTFEDLRLASRWGSADDVKKKRERTFENLRLASCWGSPDDVKTKRDSERTFENLRRTSRWGNAEYVKKKERELLKICALLRAEEAPTSPCDCEVATGARQSWRILKSVKRDPICATTDQTSVKRDLRSGEFS
jgi:hypothetical protein